MQTEKNNPGTENEVTKKSNGWDDKYFPNWYKNMDIKSQLISLFVNLLITILAGYAAYHYVTMFITKN